MSAVVGERDKLLQAAATRNLTPRQGKDLSLTVDAGSFHVAVDGTPTPAYVEFTAHKIDLGGADTWVASNGATLTGSGPTRRLYFANMPGETAVVTLTTVEDGQIYSDKAGISKVRDGLPGADADPNDITPEALLTSLEGRITKSQLFADLKSEINLITDPVSVAGSVQARVQAETTNRVAAIAVEAQQRADAISQEVGDRIAAVLGEANARSTYVQGYTYSKQETTQALSIQATQIAAAYTTYTDQKTAQAVTTASADVRTYGYSKATVDSSIAASESRLRAEFVGAGGASEAFVTNYAYSRAYIDRAEAAQSSALTTTFQGLANSAVIAATASGQSLVRPIDDGVAWMGGVVATVTDGKVGAKTRRNAGNGYEVAECTTFTVIDTTRSYRVRFWARAAAGTNGRLYHDLRQFVAADFTAVNSGNGGRSPYQPADIAAHPEWREYDFIWDASTWQAGTTHVKPDFLLNYQGSTGYWEVQGYSFVDVTDAVRAQIGATVAAAADVRDYSFSKSDINAAEAAQSSTLTANFAVRADTARDAAISASSADVRNYSYAKSTVDSAIAASESRLRSEFVSSGGATEGFVTSYAYSKSQIDQSEALQSSTLTTNYQAAANAARDQATTTAAADVRNYSYSKSTVDQAFSSQSSTITAAYTSYADTGKAAAIAAAAADIRNYSYSKATVDGAIAQSTSSLTTTVGGHTATLQTQATSIDGLSTQITLKSDINGYITGYGLASTSYNGAPSSIFIINAGAFSVVAPGAAPKTMFTVGLVNGVAQMVIRGDVLADGIITARALRIGTSDNIVPDPAFHDLEWWGRPTATVVRESSFWRGGATLWFTPNNASTPTDRRSSNFPLTPGATYRFEMQIGLSEDFAGQLSVGAEIPGIGDQQFGKGSAGENWPDGYPMQFNGSSARGNFTYSDTYTVPDNGFSTYSNIRTRVYVAAGSCKIGSISITRMSDNTLITDQGITTPKLATDAVDARVVAADAVRTRNLYAESVITDKIIANGISDVDIFSSGIPSGTGLPFVVTRRSKVIISLKFGQDNSTAELYRPTFPTGTESMQLIAGNAGTTGMIAATLDAGTYYIGANGLVGFAYILKVMK